MGLADENLANFSLDESIKDYEFGTFFLLGAEIRAGPIGTVFKCQEKLVNFHEHENETDELIAGLERGMSVLSMASGLAEPIFPPPQVGDCNRMGATWTVKLIEKNANRKFHRASVGNLLRLNHNNLPRLKMIFEDVHHLRIVSEYLSGENLVDRLLSSPDETYPERLVSDYSRQICDAISYLHDNGVVHSNIKFENLILASCAPSAPLKLTDFALGTILGSELQIHTVCGMTGYCAPELLRGTKFTGAVDMWSFGVLVYIMLSGESPFKGFSEEETFENIISGNYMMDFERWETVSMQAKEFVKNLLDMSPTERCSAKEALTYPWLRGICGDSILDAAPLRDFKEMTDLKLAPVKALRSPAVKSHQFGTKRVRCFHPLSCDSWLSPCAVLQTRIENEEGNASAFAGSVLNMPPQFDDIIKDSWRVTAVGSDIFEPHHLEEDN